MFSTSATTSDQCKREDDGSTVGLGLLELARVERAAKLQRLALLLLPTPNRSPSLHTPSATTAARHPTIADPRTLHSACKHSERTDRFVDLPPVLETPLQRFHLHSTRISTDP
eukprot:3337976-Rhodomonas_salina.2